MSEPLRWLADDAAVREAAGLRRTLRPRPADEDGLLDLASNDYLGLARDPAVTEAAAAAAKEWGAGATGSRLVTGTTELHAELEVALAGHTGTEAALVFSSGYLANLGVLTALAGPGTLVVSDADNHASLIDACRLSRAHVVVTGHRDVGAVEAALATRSEERAFVVTDAVFSVDGERAPLAALHDAVRRHRAVLIADDAHGLGVVGERGEGAVAAAGLTGEPDVVVTVTMSKALGSQGGAVLGSQDLVGHLVDTCRPFIFDTGLAPACAGAALAALQVLAPDAPPAPAALAASARGAAARLAALARAAGLTAATPDAAVVGVRVGRPGDAVAAAAHCLEHGIRVGCFRPPSVPDGVSRLRLTGRADLTEEQLRRAGAALVAVAAAIRTPPARR